jgi:hypothetical protein
VDMLPRNDGPIVLSRKRSRSSGHNQNSELQQTVCQALPGDKWQKTNLKGTTGLTDGPRASKK